MSQWDVVRVDLPPPPGGSGHEQSGHRPAVVVQADLGSKIPTAVVIPTTTRLAALRFPCTIRVEPSAGNGLLEPSVLLVFQLRALDPSRIVRTMGRLEDDYVGKVKLEIKHLLGF